jgi:hypothetical protein
MEDISTKIENAEPKELVEMADKMLEIERKLSRISKLGAGESLKTRTKPERPYEAVGIEEYIPETDWDIDEESVSADDLLVPVTQLHPVVILRTADPSEMSQSLNLGDI